MNEQERTAAIAAAEDEIRERRAFVGGGDAARENSRLLREAKTRLRDLRFAQPTAPRSPAFFEVPLDEASASSPAVSSTSTSSARSGSGAGSAGASPPNRR